MTKKRVAILISGRGSNMQALIEACAMQDFPAEVALVVANNLDAYGLSKAGKHGIEARVVNSKDYQSRKEYDAELHRVLTAAKIDIVCLAGFMRVLSDHFVRKWQGRMLNIHPSLLPSFRGLRAQAQALEAGVRIAGCSVHFVVPEVDAGPIIVQAAVPVLPGDDEEALSARILKQEHRIYPMALKWVAEGRLHIVDGRVKIDEAVVDDTQALSVPQAD